MLDRYDQDLLLDYLEGELDADRRAQLDAVLAEDAQLASLLQAIASDRAALRALPKAEAPGDLAQDLTQSLERHMLLDDTAADAGPIPLARGNDRVDELVGGLRWGRVLGLTGLAASVAMAAGLVVLTMGPDPLVRTADILGENQDAADAAEAEESADPPTPVDPAGGLALRDNATRAGDDVAPGAATVARPADAASALPEALDRALAGLSSDGPSAGDAASPAFEPERVPERVPATALRDEQAVALAVIDPPQRKLVLYSDRPEQTRERLFTFCIDNGIPIVRPDRAALADAAGQAGDTPAEPDLDPNALLIDPQQLDAVLVRMNNDLVIDAQGFNLRRALSNTAAVVAPIDAQARRSDPPAGLALAESDALDETATSPPPAAQPIKLHAPDDLGSDYANSRNSTNLFVEQQRNTFRYAQTSPAAGLQQAQHQGPAQAQPAPAEALNAAARQRAQRVNDPQQPADDKADAPPAQDTPAPPRTPTAVIDPLRVNLLGPHLPLAETTPIWAWLANDQSPPRYLVPIRIQRATVDEVNRVRRAQLAEQARQREPGDEDAPEPLIAEPDPADVRETGDADEGTPGTP